MLSPAAEVVLFPEPYSNLCEDTGSLSGAQEQSNRLLFERENACFAANLSLVVTDKKDLQTCKIKLYYMVRVLLD